MLRALLYAYVLGGLTFIPLVIAAVFFITIYTSVPIGDADLAKRTRGRLEATNTTSTTEEDNNADDAKTENPDSTSSSSSTTNPPTNDLPKTRKGWLTMRRTFEESTTDGSYVTLVRSFLDSRSKDPKRSRPKDMWYVVLKGTVLYLYEDEGMTECEAAVEMGRHRVVVYPEGLPDGELFAKRNALCLVPKEREGGREGMPSVTRQMQMEKDVQNEEGAEKASKDTTTTPAVDAEKNKELAAARDEAMDPTTPWFIFVRSNVEMEDWYFALLHASSHPAQLPTLAPLRAIFDPAHMADLIATLDEQPDVIPMRWLNALLGRIFLSHYRTHNLEAYIIGRLMKKLAKVKRPAFLTEIAVTQVSVGNKAPMLSKPMLKELTREGDAAIEVHMKYKGEIRITVEATAVINLGARFKSYTVKLQLAAVLRELEGNLLIKVKRPPSNRIWYAFTQTPRMVLEVEPIVSDRQITWGMILGTIESKFKEIIQESVVMPNMDDIAFFETGTYEHRGGIFSDTCRKPPRADSADESEDSNSTSASPPPMADDAQSTASAPLPDTTTSNTSITTNTTTGTTTTNATTTNSTSGTSSDPETSSSGINPLVTRSATDVLDPAEERNARRRTWFSGAKSEDMSASPPVMEPTSTSDSDGSRGRTLEADLSSSSSSSNSNSMRSRSTPKPTATSGAGREKTPERKEDGLLPAAVVAEGSSTGGSLHPYGHGYGHNGSRRASVSSQLSRKNGGSELGIGSSSSTPSTPRKSSAPDSTTTANTNANAGISASPPGASFFSTLKSKAAAADKQAISNTAKEALRKWGANWGGFNKKESSADEGQTSGSGAGSGSGLYPASGGSETNTFLNKARASYAEVRAAVNERKERSYLDSGDEAGPSTSRPTSPVIPRTRVTSTSKPVLPNGSVYLETPSNPSIVTSAARLGGSGSVGVGPKLGPKKSTPSLGRVSTETPEGLDGLGVETPGQKLHAPIHVQPVAKTMSIPGIHASHRGDVQSLGYVAPQQSSSSSSSSNSGAVASGSGSGSGQQDQQNASGSGSGGASEGMMKNPAIQTVYRLWKNPAATSSTAATTTGSSSSVADATPTTEGAAADTTQEGINVNTTHAVPAAIVQHPAIKPGPPPPLPPRTVHPPSATSTSSGTAEEALKTIAARMEESSRSSSSPPSTPPRVSGPRSGEGGESRSSESGSGSRLAEVKVAGPALPPRRVQTPA